MWRFINILSASVVAYGFLLDKDLQQGQGQAQYLSVSTYMTDQTHINHEFEKLRREQELTMNLLTKQLQQKFAEMQSQISNQSVVNESCLTNNAALKQKYLELEENNTRLSDSLKSLQLKYDSLISALANKTSELKDSLQDLKQLQNIQQLQTVDNLQQKVKSIEVFVNSLRSHEQARNQDFLALYNLTTHSKEQFQISNSKMSDRLDNITAVSQKMISNLEKRISDQLYVIDSRIYNSSDQANTQMNGLSKQVTDFVQEIQSVEKWQNDSLAAVKQQSYENSMKVALSACVASKSNVSPSTTIKFPEIKTSEGIINQHLTSFKSSGVFVCEVPGLYHISVVIMSNTNGAYVKISKNNIELIKGNIDNYYTVPQLDSHSNAAVVVSKLQKGDTIDIKPGNIEMSINGNSYSCLTIVKVK